MCTLISVELVLIVKGERGIINVYGLLQNEYIISRRKGIIGVRSSTAVHAWYVTFLFKYGQYWFGMEKNWN